MEIGEGEDENKCKEAENLAAAAGEESNRKNPLGRASEILPKFLYLGSYDDLYNYLSVSRDLPISHILNTVSGFRLSYPEVVTCHTLQDQEDKFDDAIRFLDQCEKDSGRVLVFCMTGNRRSSAIVIAYLMKCKGWGLVQSYQWVKERRPSVDLSPGVNQQLKEYEQKIFGSAKSNPENGDAGLPILPGGIDIKSSSNNAAVQASSEYPTTHPREKSTSWKPPVVEVNIHDQWSKRPMVHFSSLDKLPVAPYPIKRCKTVVPVTKGSRLPRKTRRNP